MPVQFNRESSFSKAYSKGQKEGSQRRYRDAATRIIDQNAANKEAETINAANLDKRLRGAYSATSPEPSGSAPLAREAAPNIPVGPSSPAVAKPSPLASNAPSEINIERIVATSPGYGLAGAKLTSDRRAREQAREDEVTKTFVDLVGKDPATAIAYAKQNGMPITPGFEAALRDQWFSGALADAGARLAIEYKGDPRGYQKAMGVALEYLRGQLEQRQGIIPGAAASQVPAAGMPAPNPPPKFAPPAPSGDLYRQKDGSLVSIDKAGNVTPVPADIPADQLGGDQRRKARSDLDILSLSVSETMKMVRAEQAAFSGRNSIFMEGKPRHFTNPDNTPNIEAIREQIAIDYDFRQKLGGQGAPAPTVGPPPATPPATVPPVAAPPPGPESGPPSVSMALPPLPQLPAVQPAPTQSPPSPAAEFKPVPVAPQSLRNLNQHPETAPQFDERYGAGMAAYYLGQ